MVSLLFVQLLWLFSERNRGIFHGISLGLFLCGMVSLQIYVREIQYSHDSVVAEQIKATRLLMRQRAMAEAREVLSQIEVRNQQLREDRFARYADRVDSVTLDKMRAIDDQFLDELNERTNQYVSQLADLELNDVDQWIRGKDIVELEGMRSGYERLYEINRGYNDYIALVEERYEKAIEAAQFDEAVEQFAYAEMERLWSLLEYSEAKEIRALNIRYAETAIEALDLLSNDWSQWHFDRANSRIFFEDSTLEFQFMQKLNEAGVIERQIERLRKGLKRKYGPAA